MKAFRLLFALPCAALCVAAVIAADILNRREAKRDRERLDRVLGRVLAEIEAEDAMRERETVRPNMRRVTDVGESSYSFAVYDEETGDVRFERYTGPAISSPGGCA